MTANSPALEEVVSDAEETASDTAREDASRVTDDVESGIEKKSEPETATGDGRTRSSARDPVEDGEYAPWRARALAYLIDVGLPIATVVVLGLTVVVAGDNRWVQIPLAVVALLVLVGVVWNTVVRQGTTGRTLGKYVVGIRTAGPVDAAAPGIARALWREVAHVVDTVPLLIGWLWPLRDGRRQSFADKLADTTVLRAGPHEDVEPHRRNSIRYAALGVFVLFAASLVGLAATQYVCDYRRDRAVDQAESVARDQASQATIALLSYHSDTVAADLGAATSRLTGAFRDYYTKYTKNVVIPAAQQKKVDTQADVAASALVSADDRQATVLVFINQTTTTADNPQPSKMSSTVRVHLEKVGDKWLVSEFEPI
jgi:Mce-associated membrane protein